MFNKFKDPSISVYNIVLRRSKGRRNQAPIIGAAIAAIACGVDPDVVSKFFNVFDGQDVTGLSDYNCSAVLNWRHQLDEAKMHRVGVDKNKLYYGTQNAIWHFANNTDVTRISVPKVLRYDVSSSVTEAYAN